MELNLKNQNAKSSAEQKSNISFQDQLWDNLPSVHAYNKRGIEKLNSLRQFGIQLSKMVTGFSENIKACSENF